jgi:hypothetical protein
MLGESRAKLNVVPALRAGNPWIEGIRPAALLRRATVPEPELGAEDVDPPVKLPPLLGDELLPLRRHLVGKLVEVHVELAAELRHLALALLELLELDDHPVEIEEGLRRHSGLDIGTPRSELDPLERGLWTN